MRQTLHTRFGVLLVFGTLLMFTGMPVYAHSRSSRSKTMQAFQSHPSAVSAESTAPTIYILEPTKDDATVDYFKNLLDGANLTYSEVHASDVPNYDFSNSVIIAGFSTEPTDFNSVASTIMDAVSAGSRMILCGFGIYIPSYAGVGSASLSHWYPVTTDVGAFVKPIDSSPLFDGISNWDPPVLPDKQSQFLSYIVSPQTMTTCSYATPSSGVDKVKFWGLSDTPGWDYQDTSSSYCQEWGGCTTDRTVKQSWVQVIHYGSGDMLLLNTAPTIPGVFLYGPVSDTIYKNFILEGGSSSGATLAIGSASGAPGASVCVDLSLSYSGSANVASFTTDITYDASELTPTGCTTSVAGKLAAGNVVSAGDYRVTVYGGTAAMSAGTVGNVCFTVASDAQAGNSYQLCNAAGSPTASDGNANSVQISGTCGAITLNSPRMAGDCNGDGTVSITELQQVVNNQLGISDTGCGDCDGNGTVSITELQKVVNCQLGAGTCDTQCVD